MTMGCGSSAGSAVVPDSARPGTINRNRRASQSGGKMTSRRASFVDATYEFPDDNVGDFEFVNNRRNSGNANERRNSLRRTLSDGAIINNNNFNQRNSGSDGSQRTDFLKRQYSSKTLHTRHTVNIMYSDRQTYKQLIVSKHNGLNITEQASIALTAKQSLTASQIEFFRMLDEKVAKGKGSSSIDDRR